jgi:hypothetical protein
MKSFSESTAWSNESSQKISSPVRLRPRESQAPRNPNPGVWSIYDENPRYLTVKFELIWYSQI